MPAKKEGGGVRVCVPDGLINNDDGLQKTRRGIRSRIMQICKLHVNYHKKHIELWIFQNGEEACGSINVI